ncbi:MAG: SIR2 family NAD-dependent protein deacylase, partial [Deinococcus sp.]
WRDPELVWDWYAGRYRDVTQAQPNRTHRLLAGLEEGRAAGDARTFTLVTQNVDGLHARAGSRSPLELHGNLTHGRCEECGHLQPLPPPEALVPPPRCEVCASRLRPNVVWFGELLPREVLERAERAFREAEVALVIGTSSQVYPAAALPELTREDGGAVIEINPEETGLSRWADLSLRMSASEGLERLLAEG